MLAYYEQVGIICKRELLLRMFWVPFSRWLNLKEFIMLAVLCLFSSTVAVSDSTQDVSNPSSYTSTTDLLIYGLVGSNLLNNE